MLTFYLYVSVLTLERYEESFQYSKKTFLFQGSVLKFNASTHFRQDCDESSQRNPDFRDGNVAA